MSFIGVLVHVCGIHACVYVLEEGRGNLNCRSLIAIHLVFLRQGHIGLDRPSLGREAGQHAPVASLSASPTLDWSMKHPTWLFACSEAHTSLSSQFPLWTELPELAGFFPSSSSHLLLSCCFFFFLGGEGVRVSKVPFVGWADLRLNALLLS